MENNTKAAPAAQENRNINTEVIGFRRASIPQREEDTIDLLELGGVLLRKLWVIILCFVLGAGAAGAYTYFMVTPLYQASSMIYVFSKTTSITSVADLQLSNQLNGDFQVVAKTRDVLETVIEDLNLDMTYSALYENVSITNPDNTHILKITATNPDPQLAADISNDVAKVLRNRIADIMNTDAPSMVEGAIAPKKPSSPNLIKNTAIGGIALAVLAAVLIAIRFILDDTVKTDEDIKKYLGINTLAALPMESGKNR